MAENDSSLKQINFKVHTQVLYLKSSKLSVVFTSHKRTEPSDEAVRAFEPSLVNIAQFTYDVWPL